MIWSQQKRPLSKATVSKKPSVISHPAVLGRGPLSSEHLVRGGSSLDLRRNWDFLISQQMNIGHVQVISWFLKLLLTNPGQLVTQSSIRQRVAVVMVNTYCQVVRSRITHKTNTWAYLWGSVLTGLNEMGGSTLNTNYTFHRLGSWTEDTGNHEGISVHPPASCCREVWPAFQWSCCHFFPAITVPWELQAKANHSSR